MSDGDFRTLSVPLVRGRAFAQREFGSRTVLVNQAFVRRFLPGGDALGRRLHLVDSRQAERPQPEAWTIVGIVGDAHEEYVHTPVPPTVYVPLSEAPPRSMATLVHTVGPPLEQGEALRKAIAALDPDQAIYGVRDMEFILSSQYDLNRLD